MDDLTKRVDEGFVPEISMRPGFVSYELIASGDDEVVTVSLFRKAGQAKTSRELAQRWTEENLRGVQFRRIEALHGEVMVSRAAGAMLEPVHARRPGRFASLRRYTLRSGEVGELMHTVDRVFADQIAELDGFEAYLALDCGHGELVSISVFSDQAACEESDDQALGFVQQNLAACDLERTEVIGGEVRVGRAMSGLLEPA